MRILALSLGIMLSASFALALESDEVSWESLLEKGKKKKNSTTSKSNPPVVRTGSTPATDDLGFEWQSALDTAGYEGTAEGLVKTHYPNGKLQSKRIYNEGKLEKLKWYSLEGVLIFEGDFEAGKLVHRKRYDAFSGELTSEWP